MNEYSVYMTCIGGGNYQMFIKNLNAESEFIRIAIGYSYPGKRSSARISNLWIISPLKAGDEPVFIQSLNANALRGTRMWVLFQSMKRNKPKSIALDIYVSTPSSAVSRWRTRVGSTTYFIVQKQSGIKSLNEFNPKLLYEQA